MKDLADLVTRKERNDILRAIEKGTKVYVLQRRTDFWDDMERRGVKDMSEIEVYKVADLEIWDCLHCGVKGFEPAMFVIAMDSLTCDAIEVLTKLNPTPLQVFNRGVDTELQKETQR